jgi:hypothetical protein
MKLTSMLNESFGFGELPSEKLMKMKVSAKDMLDSVKNKKVNESEVVKEEEGVKHYTKDGKEWTGPTHKMPNGTLMTQNPHSDDSEKLFHKEDLPESVVNEGFATWEMRFADSNISGVKLSKKNVYKVKARNTVEAIKKAAIMAGLPKGGNDWLMTQTHSLKKIG